MEEFVNQLSEKVGIDKETAQKVADFIKDHASEIPKWLGDQDWVHNFADKLPGGIGEKLGL